MPTTAATTRKRRGAAAAAAPPASPRTAASPRSRSPSSRRRDGGATNGATLKKGAPRRAPPTLQALSPAFSFATLPRAVQRRAFIALGVIASLIAISWTLYLQNEALKSAMLSIMEEAGPQGREYLAALSARLPAALGGAAPARRRPGVEARAAGARPAHPVIIIPGFVTSALELWSGPPCAGGRAAFRTRWWGGIGMTARLMTDRACWMETMALDPDTGLDPVTVVGDGNATSSPSSTASARTTRTTRTTRLRAVAGLAGVDYFLGAGGYAVWAPVIEELAALGYSSSDLAAATYDWRLGLAGLEERDGFFTRLARKVEAMAAAGVAAGGDGGGGDGHGGARRPARVVLLAHSWGDTVTRAFLAWADAREPGWTGKHVAAFVNLAGPTLGAPKAVPALLSGETRDTAELGAVAALLADNFVGRPARAALFRSWRGSFGMLPVGGAGVWGDPAAGAPDDTPEMTAAGLSFGAFLSVRGEPKAGGGGGGGGGGGRGNASQAGAKETDLDAAGALGLLLDALPAPAARAVAEASAAGVGVHRPPLALAARAAANGSLPMAEAAAAGVFAAAAARSARPRACHPASPGRFDPLACPVIPPASAKSTDVYCLYGTGKPTERAFRYTWEDDGVAERGPDWKIDTAASAPPPPPLGGGGGAAGGGAGAAPPSDDATSRRLPGGDDPGVARAARAVGGLDRGVAVSDGDGTVPLLSLAALCARGWAPGGPLNPGGARVVTREVRHAPLDALASLDLRGGGRSADHVDLLGHEDVLADIVAIAAGRGRELSDRFVSRAREVAARVRLPTDAG